MRSTWQLQPIFGSYLLVAVMAAFLLGLLLVTPAFGQLSRSRQRWLLGIRTALILLLSVAMLRPAMVVVDRQVQKAVLAVLLDASRSMDYRDADGGKTRWEAQQSLLRTIMPQLENLGDGFEVELLAFADGIQEQPQDDKKLRVVAKPTGDATDLGRAISDTLQRYVGRRMAGVILLSDGAQRAVTTEVSPQQAARQLDRRSTPLYTVAMGRDLDQSQARDVAIENLLDEYSVFVKNEFALRVGVRIQGYANQPIPVSLYVEDVSGNRDKVGTRELVATQDSQVVMADFGYRAEQAGKFRLYVQADPQPGELIENNQAVAFLDVRDGGLRVLLLTSAVLLEEARFLRKSLAASREIELDYQRIDVNARSRWPVNLSNRADLEDYDVFIVGDMDASAIRNEDWAQIAELVESGRGFMMYGGLHSFGPGGYATSPIAKILPVKLDSNERERDPTTSVRTDRHLDGDIVVVPVGDSPITYLSQDEAANRAQWLSLKPLLGANKLDQLKDQANVLAESANGDAILVQSNFVGGRVLASAADSTYRWWRYGQADVHKRFWRQCILWLARRDKQDANSVFISLPLRRFAAGAKVTFVTGLTDEVGDLLPDASLTASVQMPDGQFAEVALSQTVDGMQGVIPTDEESSEGVYRLVVQAMDGERATAQSYAEFVVTREDFELTDPAANPGLLDMLSRMTARVGGKTIAPEQLSGLLQEMKANPPKNEVEVQSKWQLGDRTLDAWLCFLLLTGLLTADWLLRKRWGLV